MNNIYDLVIIGAGSSGLTAAAFATQLWVRVALLEKHRIGGDCTWTGCVPSKTLLKVAKVAHQMRFANHYGLTPSAVVVDMKSVMAHVQSVVAQVYQHESPEALRANGIDVLMGNVYFSDPHTLAVGETKVTARHVLLATGAHSFILPINGLNMVNYLTYENIWDLEALPVHLGRAIRLEETDHLLDIACGRDASAGQTEKLKASSYAVAVQRLRGPAQPVQRPVEAYRGIVGGLL